MVVLGLGTNLGDRMAVLRKAVTRLQKTGILADTARVSPVYESDALLPQGAPADWNRPFLNTALAAETRLEPEELLRRIKALETELGRTPSERWAPREIDIDILAWDDRALRLSLSAGDRRVEPTLEIPHAGLCERPFALWPLCDLAPDWRYPVTGGTVQARGKTARELAQELRVRGASLPATKRSKQFALGPEWVGVLNLTPDSFSDGGQWFKPSNAVAQAETLVRAGATVLDLGAESTRPGAERIASDTEWRRLEPCLSTLLERKLHCRISVDTRHAETARRALAYGVDWINDVTGLDDPKMRAVCAEAISKRPAIRCVVMHHLGVPPDRDRVIPHDQNPVEYLTCWAERKLSELERASIPRDNIILDPGIGFGTTPEQSFEVLHGVSRLLELGLPILVGHSRKSFLSAVTDRSAAERDVETLSASLILAERGVHWIRVHDVELHRRAWIASTAVNAWVSRFFSGQRAVGYDQ